MTAVLQRAHVSVQDYLEGEIHADVKHEYLGGEVHAMAGATVRHNRIVSNVMPSFGNALGGRPCEVFNSDMKVRVELRDQTRFYYPDAMVVCDSNSDSNYFQDRPVMIVEVLSDSTRRIDLGEKRDAYLTIPSLKVLIFVEPSQPAVLVYRRQPVGVLNRLLNGGDAFWSFGLARWGGIIIISDPFDHYAHLERTWFFGRYDCLWFSTRDGDDLREDH